LHHISLPCRDVEESKRFYTHVLGGELIHDIPGFADVRIADMIFGMSQQSGGWTGPTVEYPHYGLNVDRKTLRSPATGSKPVGCLSTAGRETIKLRVGGRHCKDLLAGIADRANARPRSHKRNLAWRRNPQPR
jgi:catechol 2,3-dioxygenase-like lactoylglutathione lyase family enzyme